MDFRAIFCLLVIAFLGLTIASKGKIIRCELLGGNCIIRDSECNGTTLPGKCPGGDTCCVPRVQDSCTFEAGECIHIMDSCDGRRIPGKCPQTSQILCVPACKTPDYTYVEEFDICIKLYNDMFINKTEAQTRCSNDNARIVTVETEARDRYMRDFYEFLGPFEGFIWIGLDRQDEDTWVWLTGQNLSSTFENWLIGEPRSLIIDPDAICAVSLLIGQTVNVWVSASCDVEVHVICEYEAFC